MKINISYLTASIVYAFILLVYSPAIYGNNIIALDTVPQTQNIGHFSTTWDQFTSISPSENIPLIEPPQASNTGNAGFIFPINIPEARNGLTPTINITYAQEGGASLLGKGWSISNSAIVLDTRWGVPRFKNDVESEIYLLDGEQMSPVFHRSIEYPREAERTFNLRQQQTYRRIIRHGDNPKNYWWEITNTDGTVHYYGGRPDTGFSAAHTLTTPQNNIVEWHLSETRNTNDNFIRYNYQKINDYGGSNIYPSYITYNGHGNQEGNYSVTFTLKSKEGSEARKDIANSARSGMKQVWADLLDVIVVKYKDQIIRSYRPTFITGAFEKTLLESISEYDQNGDLFYTFDMEYYDDVRENGEYKPYGPAESWNVPKDNVPVGSISGNINGFKSKPTILGGAKSDCFGGGLSLTLGFFPGSLVSKEFTAGGNGGFLIADGEGIIALIDINGDGLPDKVWKEDDGIYFRPNLHTVDDPEKKFGLRKKIIGISHFNLSNTVGWNVGAEATVPPVFGAYSHDESTTKTNTYFGDFNGDELMDIVYESQVYFNYLSSNGTPTFTTNSGDTPSAIFEGEPSDPDLVDSDSNQDAEIQKQNPLHDVVRMWKAVKSGSIDISGNFNLVEDTSAESQEYIGKDGVIVMIQKDNFELMRTVISPDDFSTKNYSFENIQVDRNDSIYFRVHSINDGSYDVVNWSPTIAYRNEDLSETNVDYQPIHLFSASDDFLTSSSQQVYLPADGKIIIKGKVQKPSLSDSISFNISAPIDTTIKFGPSEIVNEEVIIDNIDVVGGSEVIFSIQAKSNVDWTAVEWSPIIEYTEFADGSSVVDPDGNPILSICAPLDKQGYFSASYFDNYFVAPSDGRLQVDLEIGKLNNFSDLNYSVSLKIKGKVDSVQHMQAPHDPNSLIEFITFDQEVVQGDSIYIDYNTTINNAFDFGFVSLAKFKLNGDSTDVTPNINARYESSNNSFGHFYRGWGQFVYNANEGRGFFPILKEALNYDEDELASDTLLIDEDVDTGDLDNSNIADSGERFIAMTSDPKVKAWRGSDEFAFIKPTQMGSTRFGRKNLDDDNSAQGGDGMTAPVLITRFKSDGGYGGLGIGAASGSAGYTGAKAWSKLDVIDMNGDRFPDHVSESKIQYTNHRGGLSSLVSTNSHGIHESTSGAFVLGIGGSPAESSPKNSGSSAGKGSNKSTRRTKQKGRSGMNKAKGAFKSAAQSVGLSGSVSKDDDEAAHSYLDMNGDGLEDKIWTDGRVALNLGYSFAPPEDWGFEGIREGSAWDFGGGLGFSTSNGGWEGGVGVTRTENHSSMGFMDVNDDALIDQIVSVDPLMVKFNTGHGFANAVEWSDIHKLDEATSIGESANVAFTFCIPIFFVRICFNPSTFVGQGNSAVYDSFQDIDGDGYPDYLTASGDDANLEVHKSNIRRTNFLKKINGPLGESIAVDYQIEGNTYDLPFSKWVLSDITIDDGLYTDGSSQYHRAFQYGSGKYDRNERQFYGFGEVEEHYYDEGEIARKVQSEFLNNSYYSKGILAKQSILDKEDNPYKVSEFTYVLQEIETGNLLPLTYKSNDEGQAYPSLVQKTITHQEGSSESLKRTYFYTSDLFGNIVSEIDSDEAGVTRTNIFEYYYDEDKYLVDRLKSEKIEANGIILRHTEYQIDDRGNRTQESKKIAENTWAITDFTFDEYGNILTLSKPENHLGERLVYSNTYDDEEHQYLVSEIDGYGYEMKYNHEYLFNQLTSSTDINGNETLYTLDEKGRPATITYPYEVKAEIPYSISYEYYPNAANPYSIAHHYDPEHETDLDIYQFEDGLRRSVQTKQLASIHSNGATSNEALIVSGKESYDELGRIVTIHLPNTEQISMGPAYNNTTNNSAVVTSEYDLLDRPIRTIDVLGGETTTEYKIGVDNNGKKLLEVHMTDPLGYTKSEYFNTRGQLVSSRRDGIDDDLWTNYINDDNSQVVQIIDSKGNSTKYTYDLIGRRTTVDVPDAGLTELTYDNANNLIERKTATIRDVISNDGSIRYSYDKERLVQIDYPKHFQNKVQIHYGSPQDSFNRAGRIWLQEDASGGREYFFDINGHPTKMIRTVMINRSNVFTYVTENEFDTWERVQIMKYPDGEVVEYGYNKGGQLSSLKGNKAEVDYDYVNYVGYDKYGIKVFAEYGNDAIDSYTYDDKGRLTNRTSKSGSNALMSDETYVYDLVDNLASKMNIGKGIDGLGGTTSETFEYDALYRLSSGNGSWNGDNNEEYNIFFDYDPMNNLTMKGQTHEVDGEIQILTTRAFDYQYDSEIQPYRPTEVGGKQYHYDPNGNLLLSNSQAIFNFDQNIFDEENRLIGASNNGYISRYTYDAFGRRTLKSHGESQGVFINGAPAGFVEHKANFKAEVSPYFTVYEHEYRKHYFMDGQRILSKIGTGLFQTTLGSGPQITAGGIDYKSRIQQYESSILEYYAGLGVAPGPPTLLALLGQPEINETSLPDANNSNPYNIPPSNWPNIAPPDTAGPPGAPVFFEFADINNDNVAAGYNFTSGAITRELEQFYYHYDNTQSSHYITGSDGIPRQYTTYFPSGELWLNQVISNDKSEFYYNGFELDEETGLYNMGEIYYDPITNIDQSIDPILQNFGQQTFALRPEGNFYYDYADEGVDVSFDTEILNSERPDPFLNYGSEVLEVAELDEDGSKIEEKKKEKKHRKKQKSSIKNQQRSKKAVVSQFKVLVNDFNKQDPTSPIEFSYNNLTSFLKAKNEEKRHKKHQKRIKQQRKKKTKNPRKVRFK